MEQVSYWRTILDKCKDKKKKKLLIQKLFAKPWFGRLNCGLDYGERSRSPYFFCKTYIDDVAATVNEELFVRYSFLYKLGVNEDLRGVILGKMIEPDVSYRSIDS
jgi:hypothetical protein